MGQGSAGGNHGSAGGATIYALASGTGLAGIAVLRVSGPNAGPALARLTGRALPKPRRATLRAIRDPASGAILDRGLVLWFPGPASYSGEDLAEIHIHGGRACVAAVLGALAGLGPSLGLRMAEAGEFTRRAFLAGKLDLTAAEGTADLVAAETETQRRQALRQMEGALGRLYQGWREAIIRASALMESDIDFSDQDLPSGLGGQARREIAGLMAAVRRHLDDSHRGERVREGIHIAIVGPPNVGKSTLLNALARRDAAIVSEFPGTTRDVIEVPLDIGGFKVVLADTAGLRDSSDPIEREGVRRALERGQDSDLAILVLDPETADAPDKIAGNPLASITQHIVIINKYDLPGAKNVTVPGLKVSAKTGHGISELLQTIRSRIESSFGGAEELGPALTRARHRELLETCAENLARALEAKGQELVAEDLRLAARALGAITGGVDIEKILDAIFRDFCIGK
ncbi:MAG: tRNA uridine-5-carboxymethylaminomethyl(34) synthesis GTPase MnmE [Rhodospirillales bacterium]|nr:tRNA uridine-5-carboxymethylaminomethyl(34) synthesis GTPase MnmE [Rhodospirillales bacterium]MSP80747.1 tRNA uridine-5-carboxymethylaminomethyl(34) synthesis GTPase MnmE [Rhodospirillales bacterium]